MEDGCFVANYLWKLSKEAKDLGDIIESGGTYENFEGFNHKDKRILKLAMVEYIYETAEQVAGIFNGIPANLIDGREPFFKHMDKEFKSLVNTLRDFK